MGHIFPRSDSTETVFVPRLHTRSLSHYSCHLHKADSMLSALFPFVQGSQLPSGPSSMIHLAWADDRSDILLSARPSYRHHRNLLDVLDL